MYGMVTTRPRPRSFAPPAPSPAPAPPRSASHPPPPQVHAPPYHTYYTHYKEMDCFMSIWEDVFYE